MVLANAHAKLTLHCHIEIMIVCFIFVDGLIHEKFLTQNLMQHFYTNLSQSKVVLARVILNKINC